MMDNLDKELIELSKDIVEWLNETQDPYTSVVITQEGIKVARTIRFIPNQIID